MTLPMEEKRRAHTEAAALKAVGEKKNKISQGKQRMAKKNQPLKYSSRCLEGCNIFPFYSIHLQPVQAHPSIHSIQFNAWLASCSSLVACFVCVYVCVCGCECGPKHLPSCPPDLNTHAPVSPLLLTQCLQHTTKWIHCVMEIHHSFLIDECVTRVLFPPPRAHRCRRPPLFTALTCHGIPLPACRPTDLPISTLSLSQARLNAIPRFSSLGASPTPSSQRGHRWYRIIWLYAKSVVVPDSGLMCAGWFFAVSPGLEMSSHLAVLFSSCPLVFVHHSSDNGRHS